ncbi:rod shape-determining protein MreC [Sphingorhabdus lutea]|uniref:Cell shape-determining protein MreC n=1 Tax=Sphingorhabdus lutea TaxID=1913578 RepID=A0A1L3J9B9_9SPHN|nr:rod shape-determining protein MreC [Sphingorhabdus lutea]APG61715.1 rod shape-determining protein MreC [Sphingorhabdus lutea]
MATPDKRRLGFSRRAQYNLFAAYLLAIAGAIMAALLLLISLLDPAGFSALRVAATELTSPVARFFSSVRQSTTDVSENMSAYFDAASQNRELDKKLSLYRQREMKYKAAELENKRLRAMLNLIEQEPTHIAMGRLIGSTTVNSRRTAILSVGGNDGVKNGQPVRSPNGLIGRVIETGPTTSRILLITDPENVVPVMRITDGVPAFATGTANGQLTIKLINLGLNPFKVGDILVSSGNGGLFPPNVPVAIVTKKTDEGAEARPLADPTREPWAAVYPPFQKSEAITPINASSLNKEESGEDDAP